MKVLTLQVFPSRKAIPSLVQYVHSITYKTEEIPFLLIILIALHRRTVPMQLRTASSGPDRANFHPRPHETAFILFPAHKGHRPTGIFS